MTRTKKTSKCLWCGRSARECWIMPCLTLQTALDNEDDKAMKAWGKKAGVGIAKHGKAL